MSAMPMIPAQKRTSWESELWPIGDILSFRITQRGLPLLHLRTGGGAVHSTRTGPTSDTGSVDCHSGRPALRRPPSNLANLPAAGAEPDRAGFVISAMPDRPGTVAQLLSVRPPDAPPAHGSLLIPAARLYSLTGFAGPVPRVPRPGHTDQRGSGQGRHRLAY